MKLIPVFLDTGEFSKEIYCQLQSLHYRFAKRAKEIFYGRNRNVFVMPGNYVIKLPRNIDGFSDNVEEGSVSTDPECRDDNDYIQYARTRICYWKEIPVVFMEYVKHCGWEKAIEILGSDNCTDFVDCGQAGFTKKGRLVAYDWGSR